jgi:hypothetical protein
MGMPTEPIRDIMRRILATKQPNRLGPGVQLVQAILQTTLGRLPLLWFRKIGGQGGLWDEG